MRVSSLSLCCASMMAAALGGQQALPFLSAEMGQVAHKRDDLPESLLTVGGTEGGHPRGHNTVRKNPEQLPIGVALDCRRGQLRRLWGEMVGERAGLDLRRPM